MEMWKVIKALQLSLAARNTEPSVSLQLKHSLGKGLAESSRVEASVQTQDLFHHLVGRERDCYHGNGAEVVDGHAAVQSFGDAVLSEGEGQCAHQTCAICGNECEQTDMNACNVCQKHF